MKALNDTRSAHSTTTYQMERFIEMARAPLSMHLLLQDGLTKLVVIQSVI